GSALCDCLRQVTTYPGPGSVGCRLNQRGSQAMGTVSESNGDRSELGRARERKNVRMWRMRVLARTREMTGESKTRSGATSKVPDGARILIVCDDDSETIRIRAPSGTFDVAPERVLL